MERAVTTDRALGTVTCVPVLFDFGGVVIRTPFELVAAFERRHGLDPGATGIHGPFDPAQDPTWRDVISGTLSERDYWQAHAERMAAVLGPRDDPLRTLIDALFDLPAADIVRPETAALVEELEAAGQPVAGLTNDLARFHDPAWIDRMDIVKRFDPMIDLSHTGVLKPAAAAYRYALDRLGCGPTGVVFVDDQPVNVEGARAVGIEAVWFDVTDPAGSIRRVREVLATRGSGT